MKITASKESVRARVASLVGKEKVLFTNRGNTAIKEALKFAKTHGRTRLLLPDMGGWLTYPQFAKQLKFETIYLKTHRGLIDPASITGGNDTVLLCSSMPAYAFLMDVVAIAQRCKELDILFINDVAASIGTKAATHGDIILGSFGRAKPLPLEEGGFLAFPEDELPEPFDSLKEPDLDYALLLALLDSLDNRCVRMRAFASRLKSFLPKDSLIHPSLEGYNVLASFTTDEQREMLINKARTFYEDIEYTLCPRYIRVDEPAVSFECKRLFGYISEVDYDDV